MTSTQPREGQHSPNFPKVLYAASMAGMKIGHLEHNEYADVDRSMIFQTVAEVSDTLVIKIEVPPYGNPVGLATLLMRDGVGEEPFLVVCMWEIGSFLSNGMVLYIIDNEFISQMGDAEVSEIIAASMDPGAEKRDFESGILYVLEPDGDVASRISERMAEAGEGSDVSYAACAGAYIGTNTPERLVGLIKIGPRSAIQAVADGARVAESELVLGDIIEAKEDRN